jgi:hypothetical protein
MNNKNDYFEKCKEHILDTIDDLIDQNDYVCDISMKLTEGENTNGSWYCSTYKAKKDLSNWLNNSEDIEEFIDYYQLTYGEKVPYDGLTEPELYHCLMMISGVERIFNSLEWTQDNWHELKTITKKDIKQIEKQLKEMRDFE